MLKNIIKNNLQILISTIGTERIYFWMGKKLIILMYHRVLPLSHKAIKTEQSGMFVYEDTFKMQMHILKESYNIITINEWIKKIRNNKTLPNLSIAITFDDGWIDNYQYAYPILKKLNIPATIFLVSDYVNSDYRYWPSRLSNLLLNKEIHKYINMAEFKWLKNIKLSFRIEGIKRLEKSHIDEIIFNCKKHSDKDLENYICDMENVLNLTKENNERDMLNFNEVNAMINSRLITIGSHTRNHLRLNSMLKRNEIEDEIINSKKILQDIIHSDINIFCYPNGEFNEYALQVVKANYQAACTTIKGINNKYTDIHKLKRIGIHEDVSNNKNLFISRLSGIF